MPFDQLPTLCLADGTVREPALGKSLFKQDAKGYLQWYLRNVVSTIVNTNSRVHSRTTQKQAVSILQNRQTPADVYKTCTLVPKKRAVALACSGSVVTGESIQVVDVVHQPPVLGGRHASSVLAPEKVPALLQLVILQETAVLYNARLVARGESSGLSMELCVALQGSSGTLQRNPHITGDKVTFASMQKDTASLRMVSQLVCIRCAPPLLLAGGFLHCVAGVSGKVTRLFVYFAWTGA
jgi:hypothetical protein